MTRSSNSTDNIGPSRATDAAAAEADKRRDDTLTRIRAALLEDRLSVMDLSGESQGTDPYNSGVHRALAKAHEWGKRSR